MGISCEFSISKVTNGVGGVNGNSKGLTPLYAGSIPVPSTTVGK